MQCCRYLLRGPCWKSSWSVMWLNGMVALQQFNNFHNWGKYKTILGFWDLQKFLDITHYLWDYSNCLTLKLSHFWHKTRCSCPVISKTKVVKPERHFVRNKTFPDFHFLSGSTRHWAICGMPSSYPGSLSTDTVGQKLGCSETSQSIGFWWPRKPPSSVVNDLESKLAKIQHYCIIQED